MDLDKTKLLPLNLCPGQSATEPIEVEENPFGSESYVFHTQKLHCTKLFTSVKITKNEVGCRDETVPKTVETRRHCEED